MKRNSLPPYGSPEYKSWAYEKMKESNRGHNYQYYTDELGEKWEKQGYEFHRFERTTFGIKDVSTPSECAAKEVAEQYRKDGYYARVIAGYEKNVQHIKMFSVIYKKRGK